MLLRRFMQLKRTGIPTVLSLHGNKGNADEIIKVIALFDRPFLCIQRRSMTRQAEWKRHEWP
ncbi:MAG: hypothetical protein JWQ21_432 [Herminiimonas sp.]|nr:hypothetical protein [Herminiimonas sp.]